MVRGIFATMSVLAWSACATAPLSVAAGATDVAQAHGPCRGRIG